MHYPLVTLVGGSGFVGRHTVKRFADAGWRVQVLCRDIVAADFLKTAGYPGQVVLDYADITQPETLDHKFISSDAVVNLVSILAESGRQKFSTLHITGAKAIATQARKANVARFVQISALGIDNATATYATTKRAGEAAVREAFPGAVILRPSLIVGPEDGFFQRFARMSLISPVLPLIGGGRTQFQPVMVGDVAQAIVTAASSDAYAGNCYELAGTQIYRFRELLEMMLEITHCRARLVPLPRPLAYLMALLCELSPFPPVITRDQLRMLQVDSVVTSGALTLHHLGITPQAIASALPALLARYTRG